MKRSKVSPSNTHSCFVFFFIFISALIEISSAVGVNLHLGRSAPGRKTLTTPPPPSLRGRVDDIRAPFHRRLWCACVFVSVKDVKGGR